MRQSRQELVLEWMTELELPLCLVFNRANRRHWVQKLFGAVSTLGNGWFWVATALVATIVGNTVSASSLLRMAIACGVCYLIYKTLKHTTRRPRPCSIDDDILETVPPLDQYSFPSGHTMHAVAFTSILVATCPPLGWILIPSTLLVAASRVVLGLHYPSDVFAGALIGASAATLILQF